MADGIIEARRGSEVSFSQTNITNELTALIAAIGCGALVAIDDGSVANAGEFLAARGGDMRFGDPLSDSVQSVQSSRRPDQGGSRHYQL